LQLRQIDRSRDAQKPGSFPLATWDSVSSAAHKKNIWPPSWTVVTDHVYQKTGQHPDPVIGPEPGNKLLWQHESVCGPDISSRSRLEEDNARHIGMLGLLSQQHSESPF